MNKKEVIAPATDKQVRGRHYSSIKYAPDLQHSLDMRQISSASTITNFDPVLTKRVSTARIQILLDYDPRSWLLRVGVKEIECSLISKFKVKGENYSSSLESPHDATSFQEA